MLYRRLLRLLHPIRIHHAARKSAKIHRWLLWLVNKSATKALASSALNAGPSFCFLSCFLIFFKILAAFVLFGSAVFFDSFFGLATATLACFVATFFLVALSDFF